MLFESADYPSNLNILDRDLLIERITENVSNEDKAYILKAIDYADVLYRGIKRDTGEDMIFHVLNVALIITECKVDVQTIVLAILHYVTKLEFNSEIITIEKEFGKEIADMLKQYTKIIELSHKIDNRMLISKLLLKSTEDLRVVLVRLCDKLHDTRTIYGVP